MNVQPERYIGFSALDRYFRGRTRAISYGRAPLVLPHETLVLSGDLPDLAGEGLDLDFPRIEGIDCIIKAEEKTSDSYVSFESIDGGVKEDFFSGFFGAPSSRTQYLRAEHRGHTLTLPSGLYDKLRRQTFIEELVSEYSGSAGGVTETEENLKSPAEQRDALLSELVDATLLSRYRIGSYSSKYAPNPSETPPVFLDRTNRFQHLDIGVLAPAHWRYFLDLILTGRSSHFALELLLRRGIAVLLSSAFPAMEQTGQDKDHHPEGDVWKHSLECLKYQKMEDPALSWAILLHDSGKPVSTSVNGRRFDGHAQLGAREASRLLRNLEYPNLFIDEVCWLIEYHGIPAALTRLPSTKSDRIMTNKNFPKLLELYRCEVSASYSGPENYYAACDVYNRYRKDRGLKKLRFGEPG